MGQRIIFHIDVNNAFLSWTAVLLLSKGYKIDIRKIPAVIGGDEKRRAGIVLAKSPIAKKYGIKTAETLYLARKKCPEVKSFLPDYNWYYKESRKFHEYLQNYTPNILKYSIDEAFLDFSGTNYIYSNYIELAHRIKNDIKEKFGFTVNVGIGNNMLCAKMASDFEKPDRVHTLFLDEVETKLWPLPIEDLFMVGKQTSKRLRELNINTIGDLAKKDIDFLKCYFKNQAIFLKESANGIDNNKVEYQESRNQSISISETLPKDLDDVLELKKILFRQTAEVSSELRSKDKFCNGVGIIFKNNYFQSYSRQMKLDNPTNKTDAIYNAVCILSDKYLKKELIRLIGIKLFDLSDEGKVQVSFFDSDIVEKEDIAFQKTIDNINSKFGNDTIIPASLLNLSGTNKKNKN